MKKLLLGFGLAAGVAYSVNRWLAAPQPQQLQRARDHVGGDVLQGQIRSGQVRDRGRKEGGGGRHGPGG